jgi:voltage-gated potassium channel
MRARLQTRIERWTEQLAENPFKRAWRAIGAVTVVVTLLGGVLVRLTDPASISNLETGFWWALQTVTTVGYGDVVPASAAGRVTAAVVMLAGLSFLAVTTAAVTDAFVEAAARRRRAAIDDPVLAEIGRLRGELAELRAQLIPDGGAPRTGPPDTGAEDAPG